MADRHWVGGTGDWSDTAHWDEHSGGAGGDTAPDQYTDVHFDENSFSGAGQVVSVTATAYCRHLDWTNADPGDGSKTPTIVNSASIVLYVYGDATFIANMAYTPSSGYISFVAGGSTTQTIRCNGLVIGSHVMCNGNSPSPYGTRLLADTLYVYSSKGLYLGYGTFNTQNNNIVGGGIYSNGTGPKKVILGSSTITCTAFDLTSGTATVSANTATISVSGTGAFGGASQSYNIVNLNGTSHVVSGSNTFVNLIRNGTTAKTDSITFAANTTQKITGTLSLIGNSSVNRLWVRSSIYGYQATLDVDGNWNNTANVDFMDINVSHDIDLTSTTLVGDCKGNNKAGGTISFTEAAPQTSVQAGNWSHAAEWTSRVPLPQDDVTCSHNMTVDMYRIGRSITITGSPALTYNTPSWLYGSLTLSATQTGNWTSSGYFYYCGRDSGMPDGGWTITSAGKTYITAQFLNWDATYKLVDAFICSANITTSTYGYANPIINTNNQTVACGGSFTNYGTIILGSSTLTLTATSSGGQIWNVQPSSVFSAASSTIIIIYSGTSTIFGGGGKAYGNLTLQGTGAWAMTFTGNNTYGTVTVDRSQANKTLTLTGGSIQTVADFVCATSGTNTLTIGCSDTSPGKFVKTGGGTVTIDYIVLSYNTATPGSTWFSGSNITYGLSVTGWNEVPTASASALVETPSIAYDFVIYATTAAATAAASVPSLSLDWVITAVTAEAAPACSVPTLSTGTDSSPPSIPSTARVETPSLLVEIYISPSACEASADAAVPDVSVSESNESTALHADAEIPVPQVSTDWIITAPLIEASASIPTPEVGIFEDNESTSLAADAEFLVPEISVSESNESTQLRADAELPIPQISTGTTITAALGEVTASPPAPALFIESFIFPPAAGATAAAPTPAVSYGTTITAATMTATAAALATHLYVWYHTILEAAYFVEAPDVNRAFVVGTSAAGAEVSGSAITQADIDLVGERLSAHHNPAIPTATVAAAVAAAQLAKARLDGMRAQVIIPPHCGVELWDIVNVADTVANQAVNYRVTGYTLEFRAGVYRHTLDLCAP